MNADIHLRLPRLLYTLEWQSAKRLGCIHLVRSLLDQWHYNKCFKCKWTKEHECITWWRRKQKIGIRMIDDYYYLLSTTFINRFLDVNSPLSEEKKNQVFLFLQHYEHRQRLVDNKLKRELSHLISFDLWGNKKQSGQFKVYKKKKLFTAQNANAIHPIENS